MRFSNINNIVGRRLTDTIRLRMCILVRLRAQLDDDCVRLCEENVKFYGDFSFFYRIDE